MQLIDRYIFRQTATAFLLTLVSLTATVWITQALSRFDLVASKGQTLLVFLSLTVLVLPLFISVIAPVSIFIATIYVLNRLNADSELPVLNAAGCGPWRIAAPFVWLGVLVTLLVGGINIYFMPASLSQMRVLVTQIRTDLISNIVQPGRFTSPEKGLMFHIRDRRPDGVLLGLLLHDDRNPEQRLTYLAEYGRIVQSGNQTLLVMKTGTIQRRRETAETTQIVTFDSYVVDLSQLDNKNETPVYEPQERSTAYLFAPDPDDLYFQRWPGRFRTELHERLSGPLYALVFVFIALATVSFARTTRQGRGLAVVLAALLGLGARFIGYGLSGMAASRPWMGVFVYLFPLAIIGVCAGIALHLIRIDKPRAQLARHAAILLDRLLPMRLREG